MTFSHFLLRKGMCVCVCVPGGSRLDFCRKGCMVEMGLNWTFKEQRGRRHYSVVVKNAG